MPSTCSVLGCKSSTKEIYKQHPVHFFRFPKDYQRCRAWLSTLNLTEKLQNKLDEGDSKLYFSNNRICSKHFHDGSFMDPAHSMLRKDAIPSTKIKTKANIIQIIPCNEKEIIFRNLLNKNNTDISEKQISIDKNIGNSKTTKIIPSATSDIEIINVGKQYLRWCELKQNRSNEDFAKELLDIYEKLEKDKKQLSNIKLTLVNTNFSEKQSKSVQTIATSMISDELEKMDYLAKLEKIEPTKKQPINVIKCEFCSFATTMREKMTTHLELHDKEESGKCLTEQKNCNLCEMICLNQRTLHAHMFRKHQYLEHHCPFSDCKFFTKYESALNSHVESAHSNLRKYMCSFCGMKFKRPDHLRRHEATHNNRGKNRQFPKRPVCNICHETFQSDARFRIHNASYHQSLNGFDGTYKCPMIANCTFNNSSLLAVLKHFNSQHIKISVGDGKMFYKKMFRCIYCDKLLTSYAGRLNHELRHKNQRNYICNLCDKKFYSTTDMAAHKRMKHSNVRPFKCGFCHLAFKRICTKQRHELTHTGEKPFKCRHCDIAYADYHTRKLHETKVHGIPNINTKRVLKDEQTIVTRFEENELMCDNVCFN